MDDDVVREIFRKDFERAEAIGEERARTRMVEELLKDRVSAERIARCSGLTMDQIAAIAERIGITSIAL